MNRIRIKQTVWVAAVVGCCFPGCSGLHSPLGVQTDQGIALRELRTRQMAGNEMQEIVRGVVVGGGTGGRALREVGGGPTESDTAHIKRDEHGWVQAIGRPALRGDAEETQPSPIIIPDPVKDVPK